MAFATWHIRCTYITCTKPIWLPEFEPLEDKILPAIFYRDDMATAQPNLFMLVYALSDKHIDFRRFKTKTVVYILHISENWSDQDKPLSDMMQPLELLSAWPVTAADVSNNLNPTHLASLGSIQPGYFYYCVKAVHPQISRDLYNRYRSMYSHVQCSQWNFSIESQLHALLTVSCHKACWLPRISSGTLE